MEGSGGSENQLNPVVNDPDEHLRQLKLGDPSLLVEEEASPISSRPPAMVVPHSTSTSSAVGLMFEDELLIGERGIGSRIEMAGGGNRWPRQETVALLKIRSEMDTSFRDGNPKGPLWEEISRRLGELGFKRSAKKCKEKFENVHKYYKRTREGRASRQDGKSYKFFTELEALTAATSSSSMHPPQLPPVNISAGIEFSSPAPISSSIRFQPIYAGAAGPSTTGQPATNIGISFSSDTNSSFASDSSDSQDRKRKRISTPSPPTTNIAGNERMVELFERLMNQILQKQEIMQQIFLEAIEKRDHDRMIREEAWKRQEAIRLSKEQALLSRERAMSASRDSTIITYLQKITGQTIQLPTPPPPPAPPPPEQQLPPPHDIITAEASTSSRWPKDEILALIELRTRLDYRYQESGPKGPLWEEISTEMNKLGYRRNPKRCKEKWENINKYYKKVKDGKKKRSDDTKTCPYYHQLDELYRNKILGGIKSEEHQQQQQEPPTIEFPERHEKSTGDSFTADLFGEGSLQKPEDSVKGINGDYGMGLEEDEEDDEIMKIEEMKMGYNNGAASCFLSTMVQ